MVKQKIYNSCEPSDEEIIRDWTLLEKDKQMLTNYRISNRQDMAIQICAMRLYGRFLANYVDLSPKIISYINHQLKLSPALCFVP